MNKGSLGYTINMALRDSLFVSKFILQVLPRVEKELYKSRQQLENSPHNFLRRQALASLESKRFHAQGSGFFQLYGQNKPDILPCLVALQTISDYLDNLCDRTEILDEKAFRTLHRSMEKAVNFNVDTNNYYAFYHCREDGGYLMYLEEKCSNKLKELPSYHLVRENVLNLVKLYSYLQTTKHLSCTEREPLLNQWFLLHKPFYPTLYWWEFAAAAGSTLGMFVLLAAARNPRLTSNEVKSLTRGYFPWICGLHILLDYLIDREEDRQEGDLNFTVYYPSKKVMTSRLLYFLSQAVNAAEKLPDPSFHRTAIKGMLALYLSDPKVKEQEMEELSSLILKKAGPGTIFFNRLCKILRKAKII